MHGSKARAVLQEGAGLCHCSLAECHITVPLPVPGDSGHAVRHGKILIQHSNEQSGSAGSMGRILSVCASVGSAWLWVCKSLATWV